VLNDAALPYIVHNIFLKNELYSKFHISVGTLFNFSKEIAQGYFKENAYHNVTHIIDSLQAMHYLMTVGNLQN